MKTTKLTIVIEYADKEEMQSVMNLQLIGKDLLGGKIYKAVAWDDLEQKDSMIRKYKAISNIVLDSDDELL